jgi:DNA repair ATPase RecN
MRSPFLTALFHPANIIMLGLSAFAGLVAAWWLFPVGLLFWGVMIFNVARDQALRLNYELQQRAPLAQRFQRYFDRIQRAQVNIYNALATAPASVQRNLQPVRSEVDALTNAAYTLCQRMTTLENYRLVSQSRADINSDLQHIEDAIARTEEPNVRREYEESRQALQERLTKLQTIVTQLERVEAQLLALANDMDSVTAEVIRVQAAGASQSAVYAPELARRLRQQIAQLQAFQQDATRL